MRIESIVTSLVFDHALRLRVKAETSDPNPTIDSASAPASGEPGVAIAPPTSQRFQRCEGMGASFRACRGRSESSDGRVFRGYTRVGPTDDIARRAAFARKTEDFGRLPVNVGRV